MSISKVSIAELGPEGDLTGLAKALTTLAQAASRSDKWDNYESLCLSILQQVFDAGNKAK